jgi:5,10-methylenetetrahydromethanopterin reductase
VNRKVGIGFLGGPYTVQQMTEYVGLAERHGFDSAWASNDIGGRDPYVSLANWAMITERIRLGVCVTNPYTHHPVEIAQTIATLDEASDGRAILGIGTGASWRSLISGQWTRPIGDMKESVRVIRELWSQTETVYRGTPVSIRDSDWVWPDAPPASFRKRIPVFIGAAGPQMTRLAARIADGLTTAMFKFRPLIREQVNLFRMTAEQAGRDPDALEVAPLIGIWAVKTQDELDSMRRVVAFEVSRLNEQTADQQGVDLQALRKIKDIYAQHANAGGVVKYGREPAAYEAAQHVTREILEIFAVVGSPEECARQVENYIAAGATLPILTPLGCDVRLVVEVGERFMKAGGKTG